MLGVLDEHGRVEWMEPIEGEWKIEGIHVDPEPGGGDLYLVADADDPSRPAPLLKARLAR